MIYDDDKEALNKATYKVDDSKYVRNSLNTKVLQSINDSFPLEYGGVRLEVKNVSIPSNTLRKAWYLPHSIK